ncbi:MAG: hypothetical protein IBX55_19950 [Methyloprofundus sp.]|nr:hypothetical protein [Methyloprofundus sp.]
MFAKLENGYALCLSDYGDIKKGAQVPQVNELWSQVEQWLSTNSGNFEALPAWGDRLPDSISDRRDTAKELIDQSAGNARQRYVSVGPLVEEEYRLALQQCKAWRAAGSPEASVPAAISDWAIASGMTDEQAAANIEQTAAGWELVLLTIRQIRLSGKAAVDAATDLGTHDDMQNVAQPYIDQLNLMKSGS